MDEVFRGIQVEERGLDDATAEAIMDLQMQLRRSFKEAEQRWTSAGTVNVGGTEADLEDMLNRIGTRIGMVVWCQISWAEAMTWNQFGWRPSDGSNGTLPLIPAQGTSDPQRFIRAVAYGNDPWTTPGSARTGGSDAAHNHGIALDAHSAADIGDHTVDFSSGAGNLSPHPTAQVDSGSGMEALIACGSTNHEGTQVLSHNELSHNVSEDAVSVLPPYAEAIPMMRYR
jgi:hypothetical protein